MVAGWGIGVKLRKRTVRSVDISRVFDLSLVCAIEFRVVGRDVAVVTGVREDTVSFTVDGGGSARRFHRSREAGLTTNEDRDPQGGSRSFLVRADQPRRAGSGGLQDLLDLEHWMTGEILGDLARQALLDFLVIVLAKLAKGARRGDDDQRFEVVA